MSVLGMYRCAFGEGSGNSVWISTELRFFMDVCVILDFYM